MPEAELIREYQRREAELRERIKTLERAQATFSILLGQRDEYEAELARLESKKRELERLIQEREEALGRSRPLVTEAELRELEEDRARLGLRVKELEEALRLSKEENQRLLAELERLKAEAPPPPSPPTESESHPKEEAEPIAF